MAMDLKMHLEIVAPFVKMAKKSSMCNCQLQGTAATRSDKMGVQGTKVRCPKPKVMAISSRRIIFQTQ